jgi:hypothetical protein
MKRSRSKLRDWRSEFRVQCEALLQLPGKFNIDSERNPRKIFVSMEGGPSMVAPRTLPAPRAAAVAGIRRDRSAFGGLLITDTAAHMKFALILQRLE